MLKGCLVLIALGIIGLVVLGLLVGEPARETKPGPRAIGRETPAAQATPPTAAVTPYPGTRIPDAPRAASPLPVVGAWIRLSRASVVRYLDGGGKELARITAQRGTIYEALEIGAGAIRVRDGWIATDGLEYTDAYPQAEVSQTPFPEQAFDPPPPRETRTPAPRVTPQAVAIERAVPEYEPGMIWVRPYYRQDGTHVSGHWRRP